MTKEILGYASLVVALAQYIPYIYAIARRRLRPHVFPRLVWFLTTAIIALAQYTDAAGPGGWATALSATSQMIVVLLALRNGRHDITRGDCFALAGALAAIPVWMTTKDPFGAVLLVTFIDGISYYPIFRKGWNDPHHEGILAASVGLIKHGISLAALTHFSFVTAAYSILTLVAEGSLVIMLSVRRKILLRCAPDRRSPETPG